VDVVPVFPPHGRFGAELVESNRATRQRKSSIHIEHARSDVRIAALPHDAVVFILIETEPDECTQESARLRAAL
jgi:hypothetical protein